MRNLRTNLSNVSNAGNFFSGTNPQKADTSKFCSCLFRKLTKWCNSDQDGSLIPQCLKIIFFKIKIYSEFQFLVHRSL
jgi:hypothetical protein